LNHEEHEEHEGLQKDRENWQRTLQVSSFAAVPGSLTIVFLCVLLRALRELPGQLLFL